MKLTRSRLRRLIKEYVEQEHELFGPAVSYLMSNPNFLYNLTTRGQNILSWFSNNVGKRIGAGSTRTAFLIKDAPDMIIKVAIGFEPSDDTNQKAFKGAFHPWGIYGNKKERELFNTSKFFPRVYAAAEDDSWLIHEKAVVIDDIDLKRQVLLNVFPSMRQVLQVLKQNGLKEYLMDDLFDNYLQLGPLPFNDKPWWTKDKAVINEIGSALSADKKLNHLRQLVVSLGIDDIDGVGNIGTNKQMNAFYIIDIGLFPDHEKS